jgi:tripartite-type tricarboxylate transporter receptor subunit TctC
MESTWWGAVLRNVVISGGALLALALGGADPASAQSRAADYPSRVVRIIVPFPAGGTTDAASRSLAGSLEKSWKQSVIVDNMPGGNQIVGANALVRAAPDGYTLLIGAHSLMYEHLLNKDVTFRPARDLTPLAMLCGSGLIYSLAADVPAKSFAEFVAWVKANPGKVNEGTITSGGAPELKDLWQGLGVQMTQIAYKGGAPAVTALVAGEVQIYGASPLDVLQLSKAGKVRPVMYTERQRHPLFPDVPTLQEVGAQQSYRFWFGLFGPAGLAPELAARIGQSTGDALKSADIRDRYAALGLQIYPSSADDLRQEIGVVTRRIEDLQVRGYKLR